MRRRVIAGTRRRRLGRTAERRRFRRWLAILSRGGRSQAAVRGGVTATRSAETVIRADTAALDPPRMDRERSPPRRYDDRPPTKKLDVGCAVRLQAPRKRWLGPGINMGCRAQFLNQAHRQAGELDLAKRVGRGRQGMGHLGRPGSRYVRCPFLSVQILLEVYIVAQAVRTCFATVSRSRELTLPTLTSTK